MNRILVEPIPHPKAKNRETSGNSLQCHKFSSHSLDTFFCLIHANFSSITRKFTKELPYIDHFLQYNPQVITLLRQAYPMDGLTRLSPVDISKLINPSPGASTRCLSVWVPREHGKDRKGMEDPAEDGKIQVEPITAFSRPPPVPPLVGPLVVLTLLEMGSDADG